MERERGGSTNESFPENLPKLESKVFENCISWVFTEDLSHVKGVSSLLLLYTLSPLSYIFVSETSSREYSFRDSV